MRRAAYCSTSSSGEAHEQRSFGDHLDKDARYARCDEFIFSGYPHLDDLFWFGKARSRSCVSAAC